MKQILKKGQKGFTLVELMVVMAIIAVLAAIVIPPVTGTKQVSSDSQVKQDASAVSTAVSKFNADQNLAENTATIATTGASLISGATQIRSNKWPEMAISENYTAEFNTPVTSVTLKDKDGTTVLFGTDGDTIANFATKYNMVDLSKLTGGGYIQQTPNAATAKFQTTSYHNYLWVLKKVNVETAQNAGRVLEVYSLTTVDGTTTPGLTYQRIY